MHFLWFFNRAALGSNTAVDTSQALLHEHYVHLHQVAGTG